MATLDQIKSAFTKADQQCQEGNQQACDDARLFANKIRQIRSEEKVESEDTEQTGYRFDQLKNNSQYVRDLKDEYKKEYGKDYDGDIKDLIEQDFEYWNMSEFNLAKGAFDVGAFALLDEEDAQRTLRRYEVYDNTAATGEGSRSGFEQFKGVASAIATDPTTYATFGAGKAGLTLVGKEATKKGIKEILKKAARPAGVSAAYGTVADVERQLKLKGLDEDYEYDLGQTAQTAALSGVLGPVAPAVVKGATKAVTKPIEKAVGMFSKKAPEEKAPGALVESVIDTMGGKAVARQGTLDEAVDVLTKGEGLIGGQSSSAQAAHQIVNKELEDIVSHFKGLYDELGELSVNKATVNKIVRQLEEKGVKDIGDIKDSAQKMSQGDLTPTEALRDIRSSIGSLFADAQIPGNSNRGSRNILRSAYSNVRNVFQSAADNAKSNKFPQGKGKQARMIDKAYSEFMGLGSEKSFQNLVKKASTAENVISEILGNAQKAENKLTEHLAQVRKLATFKQVGTKDKATSKKAVDDFVNNHKKLMAASLAEDLFRMQKSGTKFEKFVKTDSGKKVLKELFDVDDKTLSRWERIFEKTGANQGAATFWGRMLTATLSFGGGASLGVFSGALAVPAAAAGSVGGFLLLNKILKSPKFQDLAIRVYAKDGTINNKAAFTMQNYLQKAGMSDEQATKFMNGVRGNLLGVELQLPPPEFITRQTGKTIGTSGE